jgi:hypothetical protein
MNEDKIRTLKYKTLDLLALQPSEEDEPFTISKTFEEVFAELLVRECMDICYRTDTSYEGKKVRATLIASKVAEHFGVEE